MTGLTHLSEEAAESFADVLEATVLAMGANERPIEVSYRLNVTGMASDGRELPVTEFRVEGFTSFYGDDIPPLLDDDEYIASMGVHLDTQTATISVVTEEASAEGDIFV